MQTKRGDKSLPLFVRACLCAHTGEAFFFSPLISACLSVFLIVSSFFSLHGPDLSLPVSVLYPPFSPPSPSRSIAPPAPLCFLPASR